MYCRISHHLREIKASIKLEGKGLETNLDKVEIRRSSCKWKSINCSAKVE